LVREERNEMSEIQNKAVALATQNEGNLTSQSAAGRALPYLESALNLYFALGGDQAQAVVLAGAERSQTPRVDVSVADVMVEIAVASHLSDIDMIQATYNRLDFELMSLPRDR
jgi:hypothetical protein